MTPILQTPRLRLAPFTVSHITPRYLGWLNDPDLMRFSERRLEVHTELTARQHFADCYAKRSDFWAITHHDDFIGTFTAHRHTYGVVDLGILIGEQQRRGFGLEAWRAVLAHFSSDDGARKITGGTLAANGPMLRIFTASHMFPDGRRSGHYLFNGFPMDVVYYAAFPQQPALTLPRISRRDLRRELEAGRL